MLYGILKDSMVNTGNDGELSCIFTAPLSVVSNQPAYVQDMMNLKRRANSQLAQRWEVETKIASTNNSPSFLTHSIVNGHDKVFGIRMPQVAGLKLTTANVTVTEAVGATGNTIKVSTPLVKGEFIQFASHSKVYLVTSVSGLNCTISPKLIQAVTKDSKVTTNAVTLFVRYDMDTTLGITYTDGILTDQGSVKFIEAV